MREARRLFATHGSSVALESIAEASGVGIATFYRNFESRAALADEVALAILGDMQAASTEALSTLAEDPAGAWSGYIDRLVELDLGALTEALAHFVADEMSDPVRTAQAHTLTAVGELLHAAQAAGIVRDELSALELILAIGMITRPQPEAIRAVTPDLTRRLVAIFIAGMRPGSA